MGNVTNDIYRFGIAAMHQRHASCKSVVFTDRGLLFHRDDNFVCTIIFDIAAANIGKIGVTRQKARLLYDLHGGI